MIKDHVVDRAIDGEGEGVGVGGSVTTTSPVLVVSSLWRQACMRLLDLDLESALESDPQSTQAAIPDSALHSTLTASTSTSTSTSTPLRDATKQSPPSLSGVPGTWDQRFFSQVELTDAARVAIKDMMLNIMRVAVRCLLSREGVESCDIALEGTVILN